MKRIFILSVAALFFAACNSVEKNVTTANSVMNSAPQNSSESLTVSSHSQTNITPQTANTNVNGNATKGKWTQSGDPIDTTAFDAEIKQAEGKLKANPKDESLKKSLSEAFTKRGLALTDARQYASALGDFRRALKLDADNEEAKNWIDRIISIYNSINKEYPKEGEEPPPLPFKN